MSDTTTKVLDRDRERDRKKSTRKGLRMERERKCSTDACGKRVKEKWEEKGERERKKVYRKVEGERR